MPSDQGKASHDAKLILVDAFPGATRNEGLHNLAQSYINLAEHVTTLEVELLLYTNAEKAELQLFGKPVVEIAADQAERITTLEEERARVILRVRVHVWRQQHDKSHEQDRYDARELLKHLEISPCSCRPCLRLEDRADLAKAADTDATKT